MEAQNLSPVETAKLENLEIVIQSGLRSFIEVGRALMEIRDQRLYRVTHVTFETYCQEKWDMSPRHASRLAEAAGAVDAIGPIGPKPQNESQVRPITRLPQEDRASAWREAVETAPNGKVTAAHVEQVVKNRLPDYEPEEESHKSNGHKKTADENQEKCDAEAKEITDTFAERLGLVSDGGIYTLPTISKAFGKKSDDDARMFIRQCDVSAAVKVNRTMGRRGLMQYSFVKTNCVSGHARIRQLAKQIAGDAEASSKIKKAAENILTLLGG